MGNPKPNPNQTPPKNIYIWFAGTEQRKGIGRTAGPASMNTKTKWQGEHVPTVNVGILSCRQCYRGSRPVELEATFGHLFQPSCLTNGMAGT